MKLNILQTEQFLPISIEEAWDFMSSPKNLQVITPERMDFRITSGFEENKMYQGMIISYKVRPVLGIPIDWVTEITHVKDKEYFVDEQRFGPYKFWHHKHFLEERDGGTWMKDVVHYALPLGWIGSIANSAFVEKQLREIFEYRYNKLDSIFGKSEAILMSDESVKFQSV